MPQYYYVVNLDKKQYIHPHAFDDGLRLREFGPSGNGTMYALALLLADGNGRGSGDHPSTDPLIGSWAGDRIVVAGEYGDSGKFVPGERNIRAVAVEEYEDISSQVVPLVRT